MNGLIEYILMLIAGFIILIDIIIFMKLSSRLMNFLEKIGKEKRKNDPWPTPEGIPLNPEKKKEEEESA